MAKAPDRIVISTWRRNAREVLEVSLANIEGCGHVVKLRKPYQSLNGDPPAKLEQSLILSLAVRHLPALVAAFTQANARARAAKVIPFTAAQTPENRPPYVRIAGAFTGVTRKRCCSATEEYLGALRDRRRDGRARPRRRL